MAHAETCRFAHLFQPIRDLSKIWNIDVADLLEKYIDELSQLQFDSDGLTQLNFAEAALLIQGSTSIYSRKVELLYQLVYQALDMLALDKVKGDIQGKKKGAQSGLWAPIPETDELLTIDHLIKQGRHIHLEGAAPEQREAKLRRVPLFLMPRDVSDPRHKVFRISSCAVHPTGAYLLQESDSVLLDDLLERNAWMRDEHPVEPLAPAPPTEVQQLDDRLKELKRDLPDEDPPAEEVPEEAQQQTPAPLQTPAPQQQTPIQTPGPRAGTPEAIVEPESARSVGGQLVPFRAPEDPWALLDEHEVVGHEIPLEVGRTSKRVNTSQFSTLPEMFTPGPMSDEALWSDQLQLDAMPLLNAGHPVDSLFLSVAGQLKTSGRFETQKGAFSAIWLEFEDLFAAASSKLRVMRMQGGKNKTDDMGSTPQKSGYDSDASEDAELKMTPHQLTPHQLATPGIEETPLKKSGGKMDALLDVAEQRKEVAKLENMIQDAQHQYEATIRSHLMKMHQEVDISHRRYPQLYANVRRWQDQLEPVLKEFESRPEFNIHHSSNQILERMGKMEVQMVPFAKLVEGLPIWETCRFFLTVLLLTNEGNTDIVFSSEEDRLNNFFIRLLKAEKRSLSLGEDSVGTVPTAPAGRPKKAARKDRTLRAIEEQISEASTPVRGQAHGGA